MMNLNGLKPTPRLSLERPYSERVDELETLLDEVKARLLDFVAAADSPDTPSNGGPGLHTAIVNDKGPEDLNSLLDLQLPHNGRGKIGLLKLVDSVLQYSVNTWDRGFMHKLSAATNPVGLVSEVLLATLNANVHVYRVSPVLTSIEKQTSRQLATLFGLEGEYAGGLTQPGGSAANCTAMITARNNLFPDTKLDGCSTRKFVVFTSAHSHYSIDTAAQMSGIGLASCLKVPVDSEGRMMVSELDRMIQESRLQGLTPFFVNATAGTTVRGAFDPLLAIGQLCRQEGLWFHVDASWGGCVAFSSRYRGKLIGSELANSLTVNPHKMINVPVTCSFLLGKDLRCFWLSNSLPAGYLFHENGFHHDKGLNGQQKNGYKLNQHNGTPKSPSEVWDLASLSLQCGRRGDALKLALGWMYYGTSGYGTQIDNAFDTAAYFADRVTENKYLVLVGSNPPPCLQVCFYYAPNGSLGADPAQNTENTRRIADSLVSRGFKVDHAPGERGEFLRPVVHMNVTKQVVDTLIGVVLDIGLTLT